MRHYAKPIARLVDELNKLPGIGPKTAQRLAYYIVTAPKQEAHNLARAIVEAREQTIYCSVCYTLTDVDPCPICIDGSRDKTVICVVEEPKDVLVLERTREYKGLYHVLHGAISPVEGILPEDLRIRELIERLDRTPVDEVILATNPNLEGEATATYIQRQIGRRPIRVTRLARGLPMGGDLEYADEVTLSRALLGRSEM